MCRPARRRRGCEAAVADAERRPGATASELRSARQCVIEARYLRGDGEATLGPLIDASIAATSREIGPDYPGLAQLYNLRASITPALDDARPYAARALAITEQAYGPAHLTNVGALIALAEREEDPAAARAYLARAAAITDAPGPDQRAATVEGVNVHLGLAALAASESGTGADRSPALVAEFERALDGARRSGNTGLIAQVLLVYGEYETDWDLPAGVAKLQQAELLLLERRDPRAWMPRYSVLTALAAHDAWTQAIPLLEAEVERASDLPAVALAKLEFALARGLAATRASGAVARADQALARLRDAEDDSAVVVTVAELRAEIEAWRAGHAR